MVAPVEHQKIKKHVFEGPLHSVYMGDFEDFFKNGQKPHFYPFLTKMAKSDILEPSWDWPSQSPLGLSGDLAKCRKNSDLGGPKSDPKWVKIDPLLVPPYVQVYMGKTV